MDSEVEKFFNKYRIAVTRSELNSYLRSRNKAEISRGARVALHDFEIWETAVFALFKRGTRNNLFFGGTVRQKTCSTLHIPSNHINTQFFYPKAHKEYFFARFICYTFIDEKRLQSWKNFTAGQILPKCAGVFVFEKLYESKEGLTLKDLIEKLGYRGESLESANINRNIFEPYIKPLIPNFLSGPRNYDLNGTYKLTEFAQKCCGLAFDKEFQKGYMELVEQKIIQ